MSGVNEPAGIGEGVKSNSKELNRLNLNFFFLKFFIFFWPKASPLVFLLNFVFQTSQRH